MVLATLLKVRSCRSIRALAIYNSANVFKMIEPGHCRVRPSALSLPSTERPSGRLGTGTAIKACLEGP